MNKLKKRLRSIQIAYSKEVLVTTPRIINCLFELIYENPCGFSIQFVFNKLVA